MSLMPRQQDPDAESKLSGRLSQLKPWQIGALVLVVVVGVVAFPNFSGIFDRKKTADATPSIGAIGAGESWKEPPPPAAPPVEKVSYRPINTPAPAAPPEVEAIKPRVGAATSAPGDQRMFGQRSNATPIQQAAHGANGITGEESELGKQLKPTALSGYRATRIKKPWATIAAGRTIACTSVTAMTSQLKGFVKAKVLDTVVAEDGITPLIPRESTLFGELANTTVQGQTRLFVLWREVKGPAPDHVRVTLNSPAADELGEAGLEGDVDRHIWQKIGGALLLSGAQIAMQSIGAGLQQAIAGNQGGGQGNVYSGLNFYQLQGQGSSLASDLLRHQIGSAY